MSEKESKTTKKIKQLSDDDFKDYLLDVIKVTARENVNGDDQIECLMVAAISCSIAQGIAPSELLMFMAQGIIAVSASLSKLKEKMSMVEDKTKNDDFSSVLSNIPRGKFKN